MKNNTQEAAHRRKGIFLLVMPLILLPILFLVLYNTEQVQAETQGTTVGMNLELPAPILANKQESKPEAYVFEKKSEEEEDPWGLPGFLVNQEVPEMNSDGGSGTEMNQVQFTGIPEYQRTDQGSRYGKAIHQNSETELIRQLHELEALLNREADSEAAILPPGSIPISQTDESGQLEELMRVIERNKSEPDPEMQQLEQLLDKLLALQNPGMDLSGTVIPSGEIPVAITDLNSEKSDSFPGEESNGFFGLEKEEKQVNLEGKAFRRTVSASVAKSQDIYPGEAIEIQLEEDLILESGPVPSGTILFAQTSISGSRLQLTVSGILMERSLIPVSLKGFGMDGIPGIELGDVSGSAQWLKESGNSAQGININSFGMDWQSQLATSGVEATRSLLRGKTKMKKLGIKAGHPFLLIDSSNSNAI